MQSTIVPCQLRRWLPTAVLTTSLATALAANLTGQCELEWTRGPAAGCPERAIAAIAPLANGDLIATGAFRVAGSSLSRGVARWDGSVWTGLGDGLSNQGMAIAEMPNGDIIVGGSFAQAGGVPVNNIARWDGTTWSAIGAGFNASVRTLLVTSTGDLIAGGAFTQSGNNQVHRVARWNGTAWVPMGLGIGATGVLQYVLSLTELPTGDLLAGGQFGSGNANALARWNGNSWTTLFGISGSSSYVSDLQVLPSGDVAVAGRFQLSVSAPQINLARLSASNATLSFWANPVAGDIYELALDQQGNLVAGGGLALNPGTANVARHDGTTWSLLGSGLRGLVTAVAVDASGAPLAGSGADPLPGATLPPITRWNGATWTGVGHALPGRVRALAANQHGDLFAGGDFLGIEGVAANRVARNRNGTWTALGAGVDDTVTCVATSADGTVIVGGEFQNAGGVPAAHIARWTGVAWTTLGSGLPQAPDAVAIGEDGDIAALINATLHVYDGLTWSSPIPTVQVHRIVAAPNGGFVLGSFYGGTGARRYLNGTVTPMPGLNSVAALARSYDGGILARTTSPADFWRWDGAAWISLGKPLLIGAIAEFVELPGGDIVAAAFGGPQRSGTNNWNEIDGGAGNTTSNNLLIDDLAVRGDELWMAGNFLTVGEHVAAGLAAATTNCPASATITGAGCTGSAGPVTLTTNQLPWLGETLTATATGMTQLSLAVHCVGISPVQASLPSGAPGCALQVVPIYLDLLSPQNGVVEPSLTLPANTALLNQQLRTQVVGLELDSSLNLVRTTASNTLVLTVGSF